MTSAERIKFVAAKAVANVDAWLRDGNPSKAMQHHAECHIAETMKLRDLELTAAPELVLAIICLCQAAIAAAHARADTELQWRAVAALQISIIRALGRTEH